VAWFDLVLGAVFGVWCGCYVQAKAWCLVWCGCGAKQTSKAMVWCLVLCKDKVQG
jgi:hypothetical protein